MVGMRLDVRQVSRVPYRHARCAAATSTSWRRRSCSRRASGFVSRCLAASASGPSSTAGSRKIRAGWLRGLDMLNATRRLRPTGLTSADGVPSDPGDPSVQARRVSLRQAVIGSSVGNVISRRLSRSSGRCTSTVVCLPAGCLQGPAITSHSSPPVTSRSPSRSLAGNTVTLTNCAISCGRPTKPMTATKQTTSSCDDRRA